MLLMLFQAEAQNVFYGMGYNVNYGNGPAYVGFLTSPIPELNQDPFFGGGYTFTLNSNLLVLNDNMSLGLAADVNVGFAAIGNSPSFAEFPFTFGLSVPVLAQFKVGNFSTETSNSEIGFGIAAGLNLNGFVGPYTSDLYERTALAASKNFVILPALRMSVRWWSESNQLKEINFTGSIGAKQSHAIINEEYNRSQLMVSLISYLNY